MIKVSAKKYKKQLQDKENLFNSYFNDVVLKDIYSSELTKWGIVPSGFMGLPILYASIFCKGEKVNTLDMLKTKKLRLYL